MERDVSAPGPGEHTTGWDYCRYYVQVDKMWSDYTHHGFGAERVPGAQYEEGRIALYSTEQRAWAGMRDSFAKYAKMLLAEIEGYIHGADNNDGDLNCSGAGNISSRFHFPKLKEAKKMSGFTNKMMLETVDDLGAVISHVEMTWNKMDRETSNIMMLRIVGDLTTAMKEWTAMQVSEAAD